MEEFWKGALTPFQKSLEVTFTPLLDMSEEQWKILDYGILRPKAKNRIVEAAVSGDLVGFFDVNIVEKAKAKSRYQWPATPKDVETFKNGGGSPFRHEVDDAVESDAVFDFESNLGTLRLLLRHPATLALLVKFLLRERSDGEESTRGEPLGVEQESEEEVEATLTEKQKRVLKKAKELSPDNQALLILLLASSGLTQRQIEKWLDNLTGLRF